MPSRHGTRSRAFVLTYFEHLNQWAEVLEDLKATTTYGIAGFEKCPKSGKLHRQVYFRYRNQVSLKEVIAVCRKGHVEPARKDALTNFVYCSKDGDWEEWGKRPKQGARNDLDHVRETARDYGMREVTATCNLQEIRVAEKFLTYNEEPRDDKPHVTWLYGAPRVGKSRKAKEITSEDRYWKKEGSMWWPGYDAHTDVIIDDYRPDWFKSQLTYLLSLLDRYPFQIEYKGGHRQFKPTKIVITSIEHPRVYFQYLKNEPLEQLIARIDVIEEVTQK